MGEVMQESSAIPYFEEGLSGAAAAGSLNVFENDLKSENVRKFSVDEAKRIALYGNQKMLREYINEMHRLHAGRNEEMAAVEKSLMRIYKARRYLDADCLNEAEKLKLNGVHPVRKLSDDELNHMAGMILKLYKESGSFHGTQDNEEEFYQHIRANLGYMNAHGMQGMLSKAQKQYADVKAYETIRNELGRYKNDLNYSDRIVMEQHQKVKEKEDLKEKVMVYESETGKLVSTQDLYNRLSNQMNKLDQLEKTLSKMQNADEAKIEDVIERAAHENGMRAASWVSRKGNDIRVLVELDHLHQLELKAGGQSVSQVIEQVKKTRTEYQKRIDILQGNRHAGRNRMEQKPVNKQVM